MSYYWFNKQELLKKAKEKYLNNGGKEKAAKYYPDNKDALKKKQKMCIETCQKNKTK